MYILVIYLEFLYLNIVCQYIIDDKYNTIIINISTHYIKMIRTHYKNYCISVNETFSSLFKSLETTPNKKLDDALDFTGIGLTSRQVTVFGFFACFFFLFLTLIAGVIAFAAGFPDIMTYVLLGGFAAATIAMFVINEYPKRLAAFEKMSSLGYAPRLIAYLIITLKQDPNLEKAVKFAAENGEDHMSEDLRRLLWNTWAGKHNSVGEALPFLGDKWGDDVKGLRDALYAIRSSQIEKYDYRRLDTLDRAMRDLLENIKLKFREFANSLRLPTMILFTFGVMIPLVFILFIPAISMMGLDVGSPEAIFAMLGVILVIVFVLAELILSKRPVSFSAIEVRRDHPGLPSPGKVKIGKSEVSIVKFSFLVALFICLFSAPYFMGYKDKFIQEWDTLPIVIGIFSGVWMYYWLDSRDRIKIRDMILRAEDECIESCFHIGNRLMSGMPPEEALIKVSEMLSTGDKKTYLSRILENTVKNVKYMNMSLKSAFFDPEKGSLKDVHSGLIHGLLGLFANSMERGVDAAAETLIHSAQHFREIRKVEDDLRETISNTTSMTKFSSTMVAPVLCGLSVAMTEIFIAIIEKATERLREQSLEGASISIIAPPKMGPDVMIMILGMYSLMLLLILIRFTAIMEHGDDEVKIKYEIAKAIPKALVVFTATLIAGKLIFTNMMPTI